MAEETDNFELVPLRQIQELREELKKLKKAPLPSPQKLDISLGEVSEKMDKLISIFEEAGHQIKVHEGDLGFKEQFGDVSKRLDKVLEQNQEIAKGIVAVADLLTELKDKPAPSHDPFSGGLPPLPDRQGAPPPLFPPSAAGGIIPPPPLPPQKKGLFK